MSDNHRMLFRAVLAFSLLVAAPALADDAECWTLGTVDITTYDNAQWTVQGSTWTLASGLGSLTLEASQQAATMERGTERNSRVAWSKPPARWCAGDPVGLSATAVGNFGGFLYDTYPVSAIVPAQVPTPPVPLSGVNGIDAMQIRGGESAELFGSILVAPRPGGEDWQLFARADMGNGQWVAVVDHYSKADPADGTTSTAPTAPPAPDGDGAADEDEDEDEDAGEEPDEGDEDDEDDEEGDDEDDDTKDDKPTYLKDSTRGWFHIGGGFGVLPQSAFPGGLFDVGVGFYTFAFYAGGGLQMAFSDTFGIRPHGQGYVGVHIPFPVFHPMFGAKISGGTSVRPDGVAPGVPSSTLSMTVGGQAGFILRQFGGGPGLQVMVEPVYALDQFTGIGGFEIWVSIAGVI